jgi:crossover junction endodeoxyribonuclease RusA
VIELPWPHPTLSPNGRAHFMAKSRMTKKARAWANLATKAANLSVPAEGRIRVILTFYPSISRNRDKDNLLASCKAYLDGMAEALGVNDSRFDPVVFIAEKAKSPKIVVTLG